MPPVPNALRANALKRPAEADLTPVCLVPFGVWEGHSMGREEYGPAEGAAMAAYFKASYLANGKPMPIDYDHQSLYDFGAPAAGWIWDVYVGTEKDENGRDVPGVYGLVQWTKKAAEGINGGEFSGAISPVIDFQFPDPVSGETVPIGLFNAALTNMPFMLDKMPQAVANGGVLLTLNSKQIFQRYKNGGPMDPKELLAKLVSALGLPAETGWDAVEQLAKKFKELASLFPTGGGAPAMPAEMPEMEEAMMTAVANSRAYGEVTTLLGVEGKDVLATVARLKNSAQNGDTAAERLAKLEKELSERKADELLVANSAKIPPADRDFWRGRAIANHEDTAAILAKMPDVLPAGVRPHTPEKKQNSEVPEELRDHYRTQLGTAAIHAKNAKDSK